MDGCTDVQNFSPFSEFTSDDDGTNVLVDGDVYEYDSVVVLFCQINPDLCEVDVQVEVQPFSEELVLTFTS